MHQTYTRISATKRAEMTNGRTFDKPATYEFRVKGNLDDYGDLESQGGNMLEHPYIAQITIDQRHKRLQREADVWRLFHPKTERRRGGLLAKISNLGLPLLPGRRVEGASERGTS